MRTPVLFLVLFRSASLLGSSPSPNEPVILASEETPVGWGLLVRREESLVLERAPIWQDADRLALLHNLAAAATRQARAHLG